MARVMYHIGGIGLAANQVGIDKSMAVVDVGDGLYKLVNPRIVKKEGAQILEEGCLSVPGVFVKVKRAKKVEVKALDESGNPVTIKAEGLMACCLQQEIDHLNGKLIVDYASLLQRLKIKKTLAKIKSGEIKRPAAQSSPSRKFNTY
jgi:peptide deformylase